MKTKLIFIMILGIALFGVLFMIYGRTIPVDFVGAAIILLAGCVAVFDCLKQNRNKGELIPLAIGLIILIITGFVQFEGDIIVAAFGFVALGMYIYFRLHNFFHNKQ